MKKKTIKLIIVLTLFVFTLTACDLGTSNRWGTGIANQYKKTKFAPDLHEVLPESAANLLFEDEDGAGYSLPRAFAGTEAGIERMFSPDSSWLTRSPTSLLAGYNFAKSGEEVVKQFETLSGDGDGGIRSRVGHAIWPLSLFLDRTNEWVIQSSNNRSTRAFYSDTNNTQTVHCEDIMGGTGYGQVNRTMRSTAIIRPDGTTELFFDDQDGPNTRYITSYSRMKGEDFVYYHNDRFRHHESYSNAYHENFTYMEFKTNPQGKKTGTYIFVSDLRFFSPSRVDESYIRYVHFEGDANEMFMYHGYMGRQTPLGGSPDIYSHPGLTLIQNGISVSFINWIQDEVRVQMDIPALSGINTVYYTVHPQYSNWLYGHGVTASSGNFYGAGGDDNEYFPPGISNMWIDLEPRLVFTGETYVPSATQIMGSIGFQFSTTPDPLEQFKTILGSMGITANPSLSFLGHQAKYAEVNGFVDTLRIGEINLDIDMANFNAIRTAVTAFFNTHRAVFN